MSQHFTSVITATDTHPAGTTVQQITGGFTGDVTSSKGRMPAFIALARENGGVYAENEGGMHTGEALTRAGLDFTVALHPYETVLPDERDGAAPGAQIRVPGVRKLRSVIATGTDGEMRSLGVAGRGYHPCQPHEAAAFGQAVLDEGGATIVASAAYGDPVGSRMYLALKMPTGLLIGGVDKHDLYLTIGNSFNTETGLWGCVAPIRLECTNQAAAWFRRARNRFALRHTPGMEMRIGDVRHALEMTGTFAEAYAAAAEDMLGAPMHGIELDAFLEKLLPTPAEVMTGRGEDNWAARRREVRNTITAGVNNTVGRRTRYAAYQGVTEWADHGLKAHTTAGRYTRLVDGTGNAEKIKVRAASLLMAGL